jgi:hypothetical protein
MARKKAALFSWIKPDDAHQGPWVTTYFLTHPDLYQLVPADTQGSSLRVTLESLREQAKQDILRSLQLAEWDTKMRNAWRQKTRRKKLGNNQRTCQIDKKAYDTLKALSQGKPIGKTLEDIINAASQAASLSKSLNDLLKDDPLEKQLPIPEEGK